MTFTIATLAGLLLGLFAGMVLIGSAAGVLLWMYGSDRCRDESTPR